MHQRVYWSTFEKSLGNCRGFFRFKLQRALARCCQICTTLHRFGFTCCQICTTLINGLCRFEMLLCRLKIVFAGDTWCVSQPLADNVGRKLVFKLRLSARTKVMKQPWPPIDSSPFHNPLEFSSQIFTAILPDDVDLYGLTGAAKLRLKAVTEGSRESYRLFCCGFKSAVGASGFHDANFR